MNKPVRRQNSSESEETTENRKSRKEEYGV